MSSCCEVGDFGWVWDALLEAVSSEGAECNCTGSIEAANCPVWDRHFEVVDGSSDCLISRSGHVVEFLSRWFPGEDAPPSYLGTTLSWASWWLSHTNLLTFLRYHGYSIRFQQHQSSLGHLYLSIIESVSQNPNPSSTLEPDEFARLRQRSRQPALKPSIEKTL